MAGHPRHPGQPVTPPSGDTGLAITGPGGAEPTPPRPRKRGREPSPAQRALGLLVRREHSQQELLRKLGARGVEEPAAAAAVARMAAAGWQDDARFAASLVRARAAGGQGPLRIRAELATHGLPADTIAQAFAALADSGEADWAGRAHGLIQRRFGAALAVDPLLQRKAAQFLLRRGFDLDTVRAAIRPAGAAGE